MASDEAERGAEGEEEEEEEEEAEGNTPSKRSEKKLAQQGQRMVKEEAKIRVKRVKQLLKKVESERTPEEKDFLSQSVDEVIELQKRTHRNTKMKDHKLEKEEDDEEIESKSRRLAEMLASAKCAIIYTGAGISTAASIPDYRGPNGVWTLMKGRKSANAGTEQALQLAFDISKAEPTYTHMAIYKLMHLGLVKHIVSQNCDGLHLRSGIPQNKISEIHGNMNIEVCSGSCTGEKRVFIRDYDVTKRTSFRRHYTENFCNNCGSQLKDTIVHFGEKGPTDPVPPHHWPAAARFARKADLILCIGSSLKILRKYSCLWNMERKKRERARIVIVNLQWTPKDNSSSLKINGKCDDVITRVMKYLRVEVPSYLPAGDPIFSGCPASDTPPVTTAKDPSTSSCISATNTPLSDAAAAAIVSNPTSSSSTPPNCPGEGGDLRNNLSIPAVQDDRSDTSNDSGEHPLKIASSCHSFAAAKGGGDGDQNIPPLVPCLDSYPLESSPVPRIESYSAEDEKKEVDVSNQRVQAVEVETVPTAIYSERDATIRPWEHIEIGEPNEGSGSPSSRVESSAVEEGEAAEEDISESRASVFRPWVEENFRAPVDLSQTLNSEGGEPKFLTWSEMVAAHHPHNIPLHLPLPSCPSSGEANVVSAQTAGTSTLKFVEWSQLSSNAVQPPTIPPSSVSGLSLDRPSLASDVSQSEVSLNMGVDFEAGDGEEEEEEEEGELEEEGMSIDDTLKDEDVVKLGETARGTDEIDYDDDEVSVPQTVPSLPGWMQSLKPRKVHSTAKKRRRMTPKS